MRWSILLLVLSVELSGKVRAEEPAVALDAAALELSLIVDRTGLSFEESPAYYATLAHVRRVTPSALNAAARELHHERWQSSPRFHTQPEAEFPTFVDLIEYPEAYRGQPVMLSGHVIRLVTYSAGPNEAGIDTLYEAWLVTEDSQQHPATVVCTQIPDGMPIGEEIIDGVSVTGYFLKLHTYPSRDRKTRFAPMILARTLSWHPPPAPTNRWVLSPFALYGGLAVVLLAASVAVQMSSRRRDKRVGKALPEEPPDFLKTLSP
ncbi:MAG: hypothetical protein AB7U20_10020 [Planctomycetaceae bacterium]